MERIYVAMIKGPEEYLPKGIKFERIEITQEDIDDYLDEGDDGEGEEDAIQYYKEEYAAAWEQRWCSVHLLTEDEFNSLYSSLQEFIFEESDKEDDKNLDDE